MVESLIEEYLGRAPSKALPPWMVRKMELAACRSRHTQGPRLLGLVQVKCHPHKSSPCNVTVNGASRPRFFSSSTPVAKLRTQLFIIDFIDHLHHVSQHLELNDSELKQLQEKLQTLTDNTEPKHLAHYAVTIVLDITTTLALAYILEKQRSHTRFVRQFEQKGRRNGGQTLDAIKLNDLKIEKQKMEKRIRDEQRQKRLLEYENSRLDEKRKMEKDLRRTRHKEEREKANYRYKKDKERRHNKEEKRESYRRKKNKERKTRKEEEEETYRRKRDKERKTRKEEEEEETYRRKRDKERKTRKEEEEKERYRRKRDKERKTRKEEEEKERYRRKRDEERRQAEQIRELREVSVVEKSKSHIFSQLLPR
ncbi:unnamed protein product [Bemisia tabaci]|uniref:Uncharacterized protein n=1 Tax=Bemisia tabaci TaxID=7038 RepID=A0A9P0ADJ9_BEMTA|nr:unnamed protein product [Bemisia tabaci]